MIAPARGLALDRGDLAGFQHLFEVPQIIAHGLNYLYPAQARYGEDESALRATAAGFADPSLVFGKSIRLDLMQDPLRTPYTIEILAPNIDVAQTLAEKIGTLPEVNMVLTANSFVPKDQDAKLAIIPGDVSEAPDPGEIDEMSTGVCPRDAPSTVMLHHGVEPMRSEPGRRSTVAVPPWRGRSRCTPGRRTVSPGRARTWRVSDS